MSGVDAPRPLTPSSPATEVVCLGEAMGQFVPSAGDIVTASTFRLEHAGAESNVAVGLARLGIRTAWTSRLGNDAVGRRICNALHAEGVDTSLVEWDDECATGIFLKEPAGIGRSVTYYRRGSAASMMGRKDIDRALAAQPGIFHLSGITCALSASCDDAIEYAITAARLQGITTSFDVNYRAVLWNSRAEAAERLAEIARLSDIVFIGQDEANELWGTSTPASVAQLLAGVSHVVVKDGSRAASSFSESGTVTVSALRVDVVESVGAGDAFAAGWLASMVMKHDEVRRLRCGHLMARASLRSTTDHGEKVPLAELLTDSSQESLWNFRPQGYDPTLEVLPNAPR